MLYDFVLVFEVISTNGSVLRTESHIVKARTNLQAITKYFDGCPWVTHFNIIMCKKLSDLLQEV